MSNQAANTHLSSKTHPFRRTLQTWWDPFAAFPYTHNNCSTSIEPVTVEKIINIQSFAIPSHSAIPALASQRYLTLARVRLSVVQMYLLLHTGQSSESVEFQTSTSLISDFQVSWSLLGPATTAACPAWTAPNKGVDPTLPGVGDGGKGVIIGEVGKNVPSRKDRRIDNDVQVINKVLSCENSISDRCDKVYG